MINNNNDTNNTSFYNMKKIVDVTNVKVVKCINKETNTKLTDIHYKLNDILYYYNQKYAFPPYIINMGKELNIIKTQLEDDTITKSPQVKLKQNELLNIVIQIINVLKYYYKEQYKKIPKNQIFQAYDKSIKFILHYAPNILPLFKETNINPQDVNIDVINKWLNFINDANILIQHIEENIPYQNVDTDTMDLTFISNLQRLNKKMIELKSKLKNLLQLKNYI